MTRWPRCRRARAGSSILWSIPTPNQGLIKPRISTRSKQDDRDCSAYATLPYRRAARDRHRFRSHAGARTACAVAADQNRRRRTSGWPRGSCRPHPCAKAQRKRAPGNCQNRLGGNGIIATDAVAKSRADGYTLIMANHSTLAILPHITKIGYDPEKDLTPIALMLAAPNVAIVKAVLPV